MTNPEWGAYSLFLLAHSKGQICNVAEVDPSSCCRSVVRAMGIPERVNYKLGVLTHLCLLGKAPVYLSNCCIPVSQVASRRHLRSAARHQLTVPRHRLSTYGWQAFAVAGPTMFNILPDDLGDPEVSTTTFRQSLKTHLFSAYQHV